MTSFSVADMTISEITTTTIPPQPRIIAPVGYSNVDPVSSRWKRISTPMNPQPWHKRSLDGQWWTIADQVIHPFMFGNCGRGGDDSAAFQDCADLLAAASPAPAGTILIPSGEYLINNVTFSNVPSFGTGNGEYVVSGYGAHIGPYAGGSAGGHLFKAGLMTLSNLTLEGMFLDHGVAHNHAAAVISNGSRNFKVRDLFISGGGSSGASSILFEQANPTDGVTGSFWNTVESVTIQHAGSVISYGIRSIGQNNNLIIKDSNINTNGGIGMYIEPADFLANTILVENIDFENCIRSIWTRVGNGDCPQGYRYINNRHEGISNIAYLFDMISGAPADNPNPPLIDGSTYIGVNIKLDADPRLKVRFRD